MLSYNYPTSEASAQSFPYMQQVIEDPVGDIKSPFTKNTTGKPVTYISTISSCLKNNSASLDIESTSFRSDGNTLRSMIWLKSPFVESLKPEIAKNRKHVEYTMYLSMDSIYHIAVDYLVRPFWNNTSNSWTYWIIEISPCHEKILSSINSPEGVYSNRSNYINLDFDLGLADHPSQYQLFFVSGATYFMNLAEPTGKKPSTSLELGLLNITNLVAAPPPEFSISFSPSALELRPSSLLDNDDKSIQLKIQSRTNLDSNALFVLPSNKTSGIQTSLNSRELSLLPEDTSSTTLKVKASGVQPRQSCPMSYSVPIVKNITFPQNFTVHIGQKYTFDSNKIAATILSVTVL
jgi:hypothetical protein